MGMIKSLKLKDYATFIGTFCGLLAIVCAISFHAYRGAMLLIFLGIAADLLDGFIARKMKQFNDLGRELDSLSDCFVFGVAPAIVTYKIYTDPITDMGIVGHSPWVMLIPAFIFILGAVIRLAWFNIAENEGYEGLPTPLSAGFLALTLMIDYFSWAIYKEPTWFNNFMHYFIPIVLILLAWLNVTSKVQYGKVIRKKTGKLKYLLISIGIIIIIIAIVGTINRYEGAAYILVALIMLWCILISFILLGFQTLEVEQNKEENKDLEKRE
jgi:CDP-diacylglycerol--serine O-phosphatidyltransferase